MLRRLDPVEQRGQQQRVRESRVAPAAATPGSELASLCPTGASAVPTAAQPSACASSSSRDQEGGGTAPATRCATAAASSSEATTASSCAASAAVVAGSGPPCTRTARVRAAIRGATAISSSSGVPPTSANQKRCSSTRSNASRYGPGGRGAVTAIVELDASRPGATSRGSGVRGPSQTMGLPSGSSQWYEACTPSSPRERQVAVPAFSSETCAVEVAPARAGGSSDHASQRGASGPAATECSPTRCTLRATLVR